jgi:hypothetical protein
MREVGGCVTVRSGGGTTIEQWELGCFCRSWHLASCTCRRCLLRSLTAPTPFQVAFFRKTNFNRD